MAKLVFWIDVDNTLLDNDSVKANLERDMQVEIGPKLTARYWEIYEQVRKERDVVDIPLALSRLREETPLAELDDYTYRHLYSLVENYPFYQARYPYTLETLRYLDTIGRTVVVSDGDMVYQAEKIFSSDIAEAVEGRVLLYIHKQEHLDEIMQRYPADHYAMIDDKPKILADTKKALGDQLTTIFVKQGKYAAEPLPEGFTPDIAVFHIGDLRNYTAEQFLTTHG